MIETPFFDNTETIYQSVQSTTVHESGKALERRVAKYLDSMNILYKRNSSGIDFIINGDIHVECKAQSQNGTISENQNFQPHSPYHRLDRNHLR